MSNRRSSCPLVPPSPPFLLPLLLAPVLGGCGSSAGSAASGEVTVRDSAGIEIVDNRGAGWAETGRPGLHLLLELGGGADGGIAFSDVSAVDLDREGRVHVLDRLESQVTVWDSTGRLLRRFGREGRGPGETRNPRFLRALGDGGVAVGEAYPVRVLWFDGEGAYLGSRRLAGPREAVSRPMMFGDWHVTRSGTAVARLTFLATAPGTEDSHAALVRVDRKGSPPDTITTWREPRSLGRLPRLFEASWSWSLDRDGAPVASPGSRYELRFFDRKGGLRRIVRRHLEPLPVTEELRARALEALTEGMEGDEALSAEAFAHMLEGLEVAPHVPPVQGIFVSEPDGGLWVEVPTPERPGVRDDPGAWDVFDARGGFLGRLEVPAGFELHGVRDGRLFGVWTDPLGVERVRVYGVRLPG